MAKIPRYFVELGPDYTEPGEPARRFPTAPVGHSGLAEIALVTVDGLEHILVETRGLCLGVGFPCP